MLSGIFFLTTVLFKTILSNLFYSASSHKRSFKKLHLQSNPMLVLAATRQGFFLMLWFSSIRRPKRRDDNQIKEIFPISVFFDFFFIDFLFFCPSWDLKMLANVFLLLTYGIRMLSVRLQNNPLPAASLSNITRFDGAWKRSV